MCMVFIFEFLCANRARRSARGRERGGGEGKESVVYSLLLLFLCQAYKQIVSLIIRKKSTYISEVKYLSPLIFLCEALEQTVC